MPHFRLTALAVGISTAFIAIPGFAQSPDVSALEQRIRELESRLEKLEPAAKTPAPAANAAVEKLTRKVNTLERKLEVQDEVTTGAFKKLPKFDAGDSGFRITSSDGRHQVRFRGAAQADGRFFWEDTTDKGVDSMELKQGRVWIEGFVFKDIYYKLMPDFAAGGDILPDAYIDYAYHPSASLLVGKFKPALSLERLQGDADGTFLERAFPTYLASNRDVGVQLHGGFGMPGYKAENVPGAIDAKNAFTYQIGLFNGCGDDCNFNNNAPDSNDNKELVARLFAHPFQHSGFSWFEGFGLGVSGSLAKPSGLGMINQRTPIGRNTYLDYTKTNTGFVAPVSDGDAYRLYPQAYWYAGPFGLMAEYVVSSQTLKSGTTSVRQDNTAWQALASYVVTGEDNSFGSIKPIQSFDPLHGHWGALQLAARWSQLEVDDATFVIVNANSSAWQATAWTLGANWYLNNFALVRADYEQVSFDGGAANGGDRPTERVFATRFQVSF
ncbi:hypothetical protein JCM14076_19530 [Methylosoma difficile]